MHYSNIFFLELAQTLISLNKLNKLQKVFCTCLSTLVRRFLIKLTFVNKFIILFMFNIGDSTGYLIILFFLFLDRTIR